MSCESCSQHYSGKYCNKCLRDNVNEKIDQIVSSDFKDMQCFNLYPKELIEEMPDYIYKDINDLLKCLENRLWTPATVMSTRILESEVRYHVKYYIKIEPHKEYWKNIELLREHGYVGWFIDELLSLKSLRNEAMHGLRRYGKMAAIVNCKKVLIIIALLYNFT